MYAHHFGMSQDPFSIAPDPHYLFMSERHREALAHLLYGVAGPVGAAGGTGGGFVLLTGDIGTGKTTICRCFLEQIPAGCHVAYIFNPKLTVTELLQSVCEEFHITAGAAAPANPPTVKDYIDALNAFLLQAHAAGQSCVLIIDEAQNLLLEVLEQLRLLTNLETSQRKLLQIVLIGQPELRAMLARPEMEQLAQRVIARFHLDALSEPESARYIEHRLAVAGLAGPLPFDRAALRRIHRLARGVPLRINLLCGRALLGAWANGLFRANRQVVDKAAAEVFGLDAGRSLGRRSWPAAYAAGG
ncbi:MAG: AAA family ATPase, partial [Polaromonas sp.]|nr:AAA family ATPase [Polaromonas sp.]